MSSNNNNSIEKKLPVPPFTLETAIEKVRLAEDAWNSKDPNKVSLAYSIDSKWRNRNEFINGRDDIVQFLTKKWEKETEYRLIKEIWIHGDDKIAVRFAYEWRSIDNKYYRSYGNENWKFNSNGLMIERHASINDLEITKEQRLFNWPSGSRRPDNHPSLSELGL